jgi:hypothetical protein
LPHLAFLFFFLFLPPPSACPWMSLRCGAFFFFLFLSRFSELSKSYYRVVLVLVLSLSLLSLLFSLLPPSLLRASYSLSLSLSFRRRRLLLLQGGALS